METTARSRGWATRLESRAAIVISLLLIFIALLGIGNEVRFQGCVNRQDSQALVAATENPDGTQAPVELKCHRLPFR